MCKFLAVLLALALLCLPCPAGGARAAPLEQAAEYASPEMARAVAETWIALMIHHEGSWGGAPDARVASVEPFLRGSRQIGYFIRVDPAGYIIVPLRTELAPVKAYSDSDMIDPTSDEDMADLLKIGLEETLDAIETRAGPVRAAPSSALAPLLETDYRSLWDAWSDPAARAQIAGEAANQPLSNYTAGMWMVRYSWHQKDPFWVRGPIGFDGQQTLAGCAAVAAAQVMAYWSWPPYGSGSHTYTWVGDDSCTGSTPGSSLSAALSDSYDWKNMARLYTWDEAQSRWEDDYGQPLNQANLDAATELIYETAVAESMDFGVCSSNAWVSDIVAALQTHFHYGIAALPVMRSSYTTSQWFERIQAQNNLNRPVIYGLTRHAGVEDGWKITGSPPVNQIHMQYGGKILSNNTWYTLDALYLGDPKIEWMIENIYPSVAMGSLLEPITYFRSPALPYRYFDQDITGCASGTTTFASGQSLQYLLHTDVRCRGEGSIIFRGEPGLVTRLFTMGDPSTGIAIYDGAIKLNDGGRLSGP